MRDLPPPLTDEYRELRRELTRAVSRVCPPWLADAAEDLVQAALMRVLEIRRQREGREGNVGLSSLYLRKVAFSTLIDEIRRRRRRQEVPLLPDGAAVDPAAEPTEGGPDPETRSAGRQIGQAIRGCLGAMVAPRRRAVALHLQGHSVPEVGRLLGFGAKQADNLVYRGLADLRDCLKRRGITP